MTTDLGKAAHTDRQALQSEVTSVPHMHAKRSVHNHLIRDTGPFSFHGPTDHSNNPETFNPRAISMGCSHQGFNHIVTD